MTYFHMGIHTIIGAESFHGPVRDGKGWDQLAMVIRLNLLLGRVLWEECGGQANSKSHESDDCVDRLERSNLNSHPVL